MHLFSSHVSKLVLGVSLSLPVAAFAQVGVSSWPTHGGNPQHTNISPVPAMSMQEVLWSTSIDYGKVYSGSALLAHYASPLVTKNNTVILSVKYDPQGTNDGNVADDVFRFEGRNASTGALIWSENTDYIIPRNPGWYPTCAGTIAPDGSFYFPGKDGKVYKRASADAASSTVTTISMPSNGEETRICTPLTHDSNGNVYFGFRTYDVNGNKGVFSGFGRVSNLGVMTTNIATDLSLDANSHRPIINGAPVLSNDESVIYAVTLGGGGAGGAGNTYVVSFDAATLAPINRVHCKIPDGVTAGLGHDSGSSTPVIGPDGDVYFGVWYSNGFRGFVLHYDSSLTVTKPAAAFGWDITPSIVPASMVPSYVGSSTYLLMIKYNKYIEGGNGGQNEVAILDPNATFTDPISGLPCMKEVMTKLSPTPDPRGGFIEWCVNTTAVDPSTKSVIVNNEDGQVYRWDLTNNTLSEEVRLTAGLGEAYTSTVIGPDSLSYAMSDGHVFAIWDGIKPASMTVTGTVYSGDTIPVNLNLTGAASGQGAVVTLSDNSAIATAPASATVPAGSSSGTFNLPTTATANDTTITLTATRYGNSVSSNILLKRATINTVTAAATTLYLPTTSGAGDSTTGTINVVGNVPAGGGTVTLTSGSSLIQVPATVSLAANQKTATFPITTTGPLSSDAVRNVTAAYNGVSRSVALTLKPRGAFNGFSIAQASVFESQNATGTLTLSGPAKPGGEVVTITQVGTSVFNVPATVTVPAGSSSTTFTIGVKALGSSTAVSRSIKANVGATSFTRSIQINPLQPSTFTISPNSIVSGASTTGTVTLNGTVGPNATIIVTVTDNSTNITTPATVAIPNGSATGTFTISTTKVTTQQNRTVTVTRNNVSKTAFLTLKP